MHDLVIRGGVVVDGTGAERRRADIARDGERIVAVTDRGVVAPGHLADLNVIDLDRLTLHPPQLVADLPAGGTRLLQAADGYVATIKRGQVIARDGELTGARPGRLQRGRR